MQYSRTAPSRSPNGTLPTLWSRDGVGASRGASGRLRGGKRLLYLSTRGVAGAGPCGGGLDGAVRALRRQPAAAVRVAEALAVLFADLREQNGRVFTRLRSLSRDVFLFVFLGSVNSSGSAGKDSTLIELPTSVRRDEIKYVLFSGGGSGR